MSSIEPINQPNYTTKSQNFESSQQNVNRNNFEAPLFGFSTSRQTQPNSFENKEQVLDFLAAVIRNSDEPIHVRTIAAKGAANIYPKSSVATLNELLKNDQLFEQWIEANRTSGIYYVVNSGGACDENITRFNAVFVENDQLSIEEQHKLLDNAPIQPSIRIETKKSVHAYWLLSGECTEAEWRESQLRLIGFFEGDKSIKNPARLMRLPFFNHVSFNKETGEFEYKKVEVAHFDPSSRFSVEQLKAAFPAVEAKSQEKPKKVAQANEQKQSNEIAELIKPLTYKNNSRTFSDWNELNDELGRRVKECGKLNTRGNYEMRCPVHQGESETSLFYNPKTGAVKCTAECTHSNLLVAFGLPEKPVANGNNHDFKESLSKKVVELLVGIELFVSQTDDVYATIEVDNHFETAKIESTHFIDWLTLRCYETLNFVPSKYVIEETTGILRAKARQSKIKKHVHFRVAEFEGKIIVDLGDENWTAVEIDCNGWRIISRSPVPFRRTKTKGALPLPLKGGSLSLLDQFLNIKGDDLRRVKAWLVGCFKPNIGYPILVLNGEQESGKSSAGQFLAKLIDPSSTKKNGGGDPQSVRDLAIFAGNRHLLNIDNLSGLKQSYSDMLCRIATGGTFATRKMTKDEEETIIELQNPIMLNGIDDISTRNDLLSRSIVIFMQRITETKSDIALDEAFEKAQPLILGAIFDAVVEGLRNVENVPERGLPRMASFAKFIVAAEKSIGFENGEFLRLFNSKQEEDAIAALETCPLSQSLIKFFVNRDEWIGSMIQLRTEFERNSHEYASSNHFQSPQQKAQKFSNDLKRIAPNIRKIGIDITFDYGRDAGKRLIKIVKTVADDDQPPLGLPLSE